MATTKYIGHMPDSSHDGYFMPLNPYDAVRPDDYGRSKRQQQLYQHNLAAEDWASQMAYQEFLRVHSEEYNSPTAQVERLKEAGINPDLAGGVNSGTASSSSSPQVNRPDSIPRDGFVANVIKAGFDTVLNSVIGGASTLQTLQGVLFGAENHDLSVAGQIEQMASRDAFNLGESSPRQVFASPRLQRRYARAYADNLPSLSTLRNSAEYNEAIKKSLSSGFYNLTPDQIKTVGKLGAYIIELENALIGASTENKLTYETRSDLLGTPEMSAESDFADKENNRVKKDLSTLCYEKVEQIADLINKESDSNRGVALLATSLLTLPVMSPVLGKSKFVKKLVSLISKAAKKVR